MYIFLIMKNDRKYLQEFDFQYVRSSSMLRNTHACLYIKKKGGWMDVYIYRYKKWSSYLDLYIQLYIYIV